MNIPPHNLDAERAVLGACMLSPAAVSDIAEILAPGDFYLQAHSVIYNTICKLVNQGQAPDLVTVTSHLLTKGELEKVGGATTIADLTNFTPTAANAEYYARIVADKAKARRIIEAATRIASQAYTTEPDDLSTMAETELYKAIGSSRQSGTMQSLGDIVTGGVLRNMLEFDPANIPGVRTPWADLNRMIPALSPTDLILVAGRPSMGKTAMGLQLAYHAAQKHGPTLFFSLEMSKEQLTSRIISSEAKVSGHFIRHGRLDDAERERIVNVARGIRNNNPPLHIDDTGAATVARIRSRATRHKTKHGLALIVIDYVQLMSGKAENRQQEISTISRGLKALARELQVPVVALSQLSRAVEQRQNKRPMLSDLRESGALEQDSDVVMLLYRDDYYNPDTEKMGKAEVIVAKQRNGPVGTVELGWMAEHTRFVSLDRRTSP